MEEVSDDYRLGLLAARAELDQQGLVMEASGVVVWSNRPQRKVPERVLVLPLEGHRPHDCQVARALELAQDLRRGCLPCGRHGISRCKSAKVARGHGPMRRSIRFASRVRSTEVIRTAFFWATNGRQIVSSLSNDALANFATRRPACRDFVSGGSAWESNPPRTV